MPDSLDAAVRAKLASWGDDPCGYATCVVVGWSEMRAAIEAVLDLHRVAAQDWTHVDETAYEFARRNALEEVVRAIAGKLGVEVNT